MRVLLTGGSGFTGRRVIRGLLTAGHEVVALARSDAATRSVAALGAEPLAGDLDDRGSLDAVFASARAEVLLNVASLGFGHAPGIVAAAETAGIPSGVFVSTTAIFTALDVGSRSVRVAAEDVVRASALAWTLVRPTMIYGAPGDRNMSRLIWALRRVPVFPLPGGGNGLQQPVHVEDLADALTSAVSSADARGRAYDVAGPEALSFREIVVETAAALGRAPRLVPFPLAPLVAGLRLYERAVPHPRLRAEQVARLGEDKAFDVGPARRDLGYDPRTFAAGIRAQVALAW